MTPLAHPQRRHDDGDLLRSLLKSWLVRALLGIGTLLVAIGTWWTGYVFAQVQRIPGEDRIAVWERHQQEEYPALRERVTVLAERQEAQQRQIQATLQEILVEVRKPARR